MTAANATCPTCPPLVQPLTTGPAPAAWAPLRRWLGRWRAAAAERHAARLARSLGPALQRDLGLHDSAADARDVHAVALAEFDRMRW